MLKTLFVVDDTQALSGSHLNAISFHEYLRDYPKLNEPKTRVINLCDTSRYLSQGYYCSLLAEARQHQVIPSIQVINSLRHEGVSLWFSPHILGKAPAPTASKILMSCMGEVSDPAYAKLAQAVYQEFAAPILKLTLIPELSGFRVQVSREALQTLAESDQSFCLNVLQTYTGKRWRARGAAKQFRWDMALLLDPQEAVPPSNKGAISRFVKAGEKLGIRVHPLTAAELPVLNQYDALFIRETTAIDHHTYRLARDAEKQGLVVIDDSNSILRCCNKVFLHDAFNYNGVPSPKTVFVSDLEVATIERLEADFSYPIVLKMPEGSFSKGVFKVADRSALLSTANSLLADSALVLAQEFLYTEYDWRIGVLNGRALYACRYYMARNHWQIYNHGNKRNFSGGFDALPTFEVPGYVLDAALKAARVVGQGLYGIDIKVIDGKAYVLEVNDNPSLDHGVEDDYLGEELYMQIMSEFLRRLEARGR